MSQIPEREITLQYVGDPDNTPSVAGGTEIKIFAEEISEIFQKEPNFSPLPKGPSTHYKGDETLVVDTLKATFKFEISGWVYNSEDKRFSLDSSIRDSNNDGQIPTDTITARNFDNWIPLGDTNIKYDSEQVSITGGSSLTEGTDYEIEYDRGRIKFLDSGNIPTTTENSFFGGTVTVIDTDFDISYTFKGDANNVANLIRRMSQLGGVFVMRLDEQDYTAASGETSSSAYTVMPKKIQKTGQSSKPDETKLELELRAATSQR